MPVHVVGCEREKIVQLAFLDDQPAVHIGFGGAEFGAVEYAPLNGIVRKPQGYAGCLTISEFVPDALVVDDDQGAFMDDGPQQRG